MNERILRMFLAVEHPLVRRGIAAFCDDQPDIHVAGEASDGESALRAIRVLRPDVVVVHAALPLISGVAMLEPLRREQVETRSIILVPLHDRELMREAMSSVADAFLLTTDLPQHIIRTARALQAGERFVCPLLAACSSTLLNDLIPSHVRETLSDEQMQLFRLIVAQRNGSQIGRALDLPASEIARLRIGLCERLHRIPESGGNTFRPSQLLPLPETGQ